MPKEYWVVLGVSHGAEIRISMEDIGLKGTHLNIQVLIDPYLEEEVW